MDVSTIHFCCVSVNHIVYVSDKHLTAVVVQRVDEYITPDTTEIEDLTTSAGCCVDAVVTQAREEDPKYNIGSGKLAEIDEAIQSHDAHIVVFDNDLTPHQQYNINTALSSTVTVLNRYTLILSIFAQRATTRAGQLQVELANLRYELPRAEAKVSLQKRDEQQGFMGLGEYDQSREDDIKRRISRIKTELDQIDAVNTKRRERYRDSGFDLVAIAGYTNAGKSTLLRRLTTSLTVEGPPPRHEDIPTTAETTDELFTTLSTTTRRLDHDKRNALVTDTVGLISDLPVWLVDSFQSTFESVYAADIILLTLDVTEDVSRIHEKFVTCHDLLAHRTDGRILPVFNKIDAIDAEELERKQQVLSAITHNAVYVSAKTGQNIDDLNACLHRTLPALDRGQLHLPMNGEAMSVVSWVYENAHVRDESYQPDEITLDFEAKTPIVRKALDRAHNVPHGPPM